MRFLLFTLLFSFNLKALTFTQEMSSATGSSVQKFILNKQEARFIKRSNLFDIKESYSLGEFELKDTKSTLNIFKKLEELANKLKTIDRFMSTKGSGFNELSHLPPHQSFFTINGFIISQASSLYNEIKLLNDELLGLPWQQQSGVSLSDDYKKMTTIKNKKVLINDFDLPFHCTDNRPPTTCVFKDEGILFLR